MDYKFKYFDYDLSQNLAYYKKKGLMSLYDNSLLLSIVRIYKNSEIIKAMNKTICSLKDPRNLTDNDIIKIQEFESEMREKFVLYCRLKFDNKGTSFTKWLIHYIFMQILDFFIKGVMHNSIPLNMYLKNLTFTSQGTINLKQTILRILQEPFLPLSSKFEAACHYFEDSCIIQYFYLTHKSKMLEKIFSSNPKLITDYSLIYWMWRIRGISNFHLKFGSAWSRTDLHNDVVIARIFQKAVKDNNESAVQYIWTNHISKMPEKDEVLSNTLKLAYTDADKINICLYLLFQIQSNELRNLLECVSYEIMKSLIKNIRWHGLLINIFEELKMYLCSADITELLYLMNEHHCRYYPRGITYTLLIRYFISMPESTIQKLMGNEEIYARTLIEFINVKEKLIKIFLIKGNRRENLNFLCSKSGEYFITTLIKEGKFELLQSFLKVFGSINVRNIKRFLNIENVYRLFKEFIKYNKFQAMFEFIRWWTSTLYNDEIQSFKKELMEMNKIKLQVTLLNCGRISNSDSNDLNLCSFSSFGLEEYLSEFVQNL
ncbi:UNVERIFIED_CONTAM: hypothetical protein RMT77_011462 [Armadillidium vulgare]